MTLKRPVRADDLLSFRIPFDLQLSPDGRSVLWSERWTDAEKGKTFARLVRGRLGEAARALSSGAHVDAAPRVSPDGARVAFVRGTPGATPVRQQLCLIASDGGEVEVLLEEAGRFRAPAWAPDGRSLVVPFRRDDPVAEGETEPRSIRVTRYQYKMDGDGYFPQDRFHLYRVDVAKPSLERLTDGDWDDLEPALSPDGARIAFLSNRRGDRDLENADVFVMPAGGGAPVRCKQGRGYAFAPSWSPDGAWIAAAAQSGEKTMGLMRGRIELFRFSPDGSKPEESLTADLDRNVLPLTIDDMWGLDWMRPPVFAPDARKLLFMVSS